MADLNLESLTDLELAQQGSIEAARQIGQLARSAPVRSSRQLPPRMAPMITFHDEEFKKFHLFSNLPIELRSLVCYHSLPSCRIVKIYCDDFAMENSNPSTGAVEVVNMYRAKARTWISPLVRVCSDTLKFARCSSYITGFRLRYISLYFNFTQDTLFFESAAALVSLMGPEAEGMELRDEDEEENIVAAFGIDGPKNVVLAGHARSYEGHYSIFKHFAWLDTLIMEEPPRQPRTPRQLAAAREEELTNDLESRWKDIRGASAELPLIRFLPRQNIDFMGSSFLERPIN